LICLNWALKADFVAHAYVTIRSSAHATLLLNPSHFTPPEHDHDLDGALHQRRTFEQTAAHVFARRRHADALALLR
jgi:hypothetical protein